MDDAVGSRLASAFSAAGCGWSEEGRAPRAHCRDLALPLPLAEVWAWELGALQRSYTVAIHPHPHHTLPPPFLSRERAKLWQRAGRGLGSWRSVCFVLIPAFLLLQGLGPQIWHFLFGLGQRSAALEALAPMKRAAAFPALTPPPHPLCPSQPPAASVPKVRGQSLGETGISV